MPIAPAATAIAQSAGTTPFQDEIGDLYSRLAVQLERTVRHWVRAPETVIEDACQVAWGRLVARSDDVRRDTALSWLTTTAVHEVFRLSRRASREVSFEDAVVTAETSRIHASVPSAEEVAEQHERIGQLRGLPARQQRLLWLQALGLSYAEIAEHEGCTLRTVERQLLRAKRRLRAQALEASGTDLGVRGLRRASRHGSRSDAVAAAGAVPAPAAPDAAPVAAARGAGAARGAAARDLP
jgi:RNA polymerase sigma factor (sigma-70 family)